LHNQSDQQVAAAPNNIIGLRSFWNPRSQLPKRWEMLRGWGRFNAMCMQPQTTHAKRHSKKRCLIVSFLWQKQHFSLPCQLRFTKLSFVKITPLRRYHIKFFIFSRAFVFQMILFRFGTSWWIKAEQCDFTENWPFGSKFQRKTSCSWVSMILAMWGRSIYSDPDC
jgi:hypothetical protein